MATVNQIASQTLSRLNALNKSVLIGKAYPLGNSGSVFSGMGKSFVAKGVVTGNAIAFKHNGQWQVIQG